MVEREFLSFSVSHTSLLYTELAGNLFLKKRRQRENGMANAIQAQRPGIGPFNGA
jgi:hypothetical protein